MGFNENYIDHKNEWREATNPPSFPKNMVSFLSKLIIYGNNALFSSQILLVNWREGTGKGVSLSENCTNKSFEFKPGSIPEYVLKCPSELLKQYLNLP